MKYAIVFVDDYSRHTRVYFCKHKHEVPKLLRLYFVEMGSHALHASHLLTYTGFARCRIHTDGGGGNSTPTRLSNACLIWACAAT